MKMSWITAHPLWPTQARKHWKRLLAKLLKCLPSTEESSVNRWKDITWAVLIDTETGRVTCEILETVTSALVTHDCKTEGEEGDEASVIVVSVSMR